MNLGVSYNFFNGEEHLIASLRSIREVVDHVGIVAQKVSNAGNPITEAALDALSDATRAGLADQVDWVEPDPARSRARNEKAKRRHGLRLARRAGCSHFFTMDADEFYRASEVEAAKDAIRANGWTMTSADSFLHVRRPRFRAHDTTRVAFITRINLLTALRKRYPVERIDPTRRLTTWPARHHHFAPETVAMYHMNLVRRDFTSKLANTSTRDTDFLDRVAAAIAGYDGAGDFDFPNKGRMTIRQVENEFGTYDPG